MHAEYDESELPIPPERRRLRPNRIGQNDPPIREGTEALRATRSWLASSGIYDIVITFDAKPRILLLERDTRREVCDFWSHFCPEEAV